MIQWVTENTRYREDKPSRLDLLFTKGINLENFINCESPFGRNDHVVLKIESKGDTENKQEESYKKEKKLCKSKLYCNEEVFQ